MTTPRFIVLAQNGGYVVHDREVGDDSTVMNRYQSAAHLAHQWEKQAERDAQYEAAKAEHCRTFGRPEADRGTAQEIARMAGGGFLS